LHLVWSTWDRLPLLEEQYAREVYWVIGAKCAELRAESIAIGGIEDHVHFLWHFQRHSALPIWLAR
jgi:REP element-mobilizing transposase RayT